MNSVQAPKRKGEKIDRKTQVSVEVVKRVQKRKNENYSKTRKTNVFEYQAPISNFKLRAYDLALDLLEG